MSEIVWPVRNKNGKQIKAGTIDGVYFSVVYKRCQKWADEYMKSKWPDMIDKE